MNRIYRLVFNRALGVMQVASEVAQNPGGSAITAKRPPRLRAHQLAVALAATLASGSAFAACTGTTTVNCDSSTNITNYANGTSGLTLNIASGAVISVPLLLGGNAVTLSGSNTTVNNAGTIDPFLTGGLSLAAAGLVVGNNTAGGSTITVNNQTGGQIKGIFNIGTLLGFGGQAITAQNAAGGTTTLVNDGSIGMSLLGVGQLADATSVVTYGGAQANVTNRGSITGRVGLGASTGNTFTNAGTITGSVHLGDSTGGNTFTAVAGSSVVTGGGSAAAGVLAGVTGVKVAAAGTVDAGIGTGAANNTLVLQDNASNNGPASSSGWTN
jgi:fibronectin-binding autotransporter adhesin